MPGFNDTDLVRAYTSLAPAGVQENHIPQGQASVINFQAEAGQAIFAGGGAYRMLVVVRDLTDGTTITTFNHRGSFGDMNWPVQDVEHPFHLNPQGVAKQDHVYQAIAVMVVGVGREADVDFQESDLFIIT